MTSPEVRAYVERTRAEQGLPRYCSDPATLQRIARLLLSVDLSDTAETSGGAPAVSQDP